MSDRLNPSRRAVLTSSASALLVSPPAVRAQSTTGPFGFLYSAPGSVTLWTEHEAIALVRNGSNWQGGGCEFRVTRDGDALGLMLRSRGESAMRVRVRWQGKVPLTLRFLGDDWERSYGTLGWRGMEPERVMPWYFLASDGKATAGIGVKTGPAAFCFWQVDPEGVSLWLDVRNGGSGVMLGTRELRAATIVTAYYDSAKPFEAAQQFCHRMSTSVRMPRSPVYGGNNWYYAYGKSSGDAIRADSERMAAVAAADHAPWMVIDDGWEPSNLAGPWSRGNDRFPDMPQLAAQMMSIGVKLGLWMRPLFTSEDIASGWRLNSPNAGREYAERRAYTIDPSVPEALAKVQGDVRRIATWGYGLIKHDFSTYDLLGRWGFNMGAEITDAKWSFADRTRTTAEVIRDFYSALRDAAGNAMLLGCNTVGHLAAGLFELQRTGDDTSGRDWNRTRKMGVNTLAFRAAQHGAFFAVDADCVGLTKQIAWKENRQWLDLLAHSGTALFVSAAPDALGPEQQDAVREAFAVAAKPMPVGEPLDWMESNQPERWAFNGQVKNYDWFGAEGVSPFAG